MRRRPSTAHSPTASPRIDGTDEGETCGSRLRRCWLRTRGPHARPRRGRLPEAPWGNRVGLHARVADGAAASMGGINVIASVETPDGIELARRRGYPSAIVVLEFPMASARFICRAPAPHRPLPRGDSWPHLRSVPVVLGPRFAWAQHRHRVRAARSESGPRARDAHPAWAGSAAVDAT